VNAIAAAATGWLDARGADELAVRRTVRDVSATATTWGATVSEESWTAATRFDASLLERLHHTLPSAPLLGTGAGHDAGILAQAGIPTGMIFVRNPTGISHSPAEHADRDDCLVGVAALVEVLTDLLGGSA
jgi:beta-ureidopropionase / N-carbamoyl-L-amino-acid hydrolase